MVQKVQVAVGIVLHQDHVLIVQRNSAQHQGNLWEFPGGKIQPHETPLQALKREFLEEVNLTVEQADFFMEVEYQYVDKVVLLHVYLIHHFYGQAQGLEAQPIKWVNIKELSHYEFPNANEAIIKKLLALG